MSPLSCIMKEAMEEASIPPHLSAQVKPVSVVSFYADLPDRGLVPDTEFIYDLAVPSEFVPRPLDGEVENFTLLDVSEVSHF